MHFLFKSLRLYRTCCYMTIPNTKMYNICVCLLIFEVFQSVLHASAIHTNEFAVHIPAGDDVAKETASKYGFSYRGQIGSLKGYYLFEHHSIRKRATTQSLVHSELLQNDSSVLWCEQQEVKRRVKRSAFKRSPTTFIDPLYSEQWFLHGGGYGDFDMNVIPAWQEGYTGKGVVVSILDDGIQSNHPDLAQNYDKDASFDINDSDDDPKPQDDDDNKHGTRCAGEVAAVANNEFCGVGIAYNASIGGVRMLDGSVTDSIEAMALSLRPDHIHIYSASWGPEDDGKTVDGPGKLAKVAFQDGVTKGRHGLGSIFVWASGNGGRHSDNCNCDGYTNSIYTISVSSATQSGYMPWYLEQCSSTLATTYSSGAANKDQSIVTVDVDYSYFVEIERGQKPNNAKLCTNSHTGTSASAPIAAAICALALEANPQLTWRDMQYLIMMTSRPEPLQREDGWITNGIGRKVSTKFGYGLMNAAGMVKLAKKWKTVPKHQICTTLQDNTERVIPVNSDEKLETSINTTACKNTKNAVSSLEHVQVVISLNFHPRGNLHITLVSPSNTHSVILLPRPHDNVSGTFKEWPFMSVHFWGEDPQGTWRLVINNDGNTMTTSAGKLTNWYLVFYGTESKLLNLVSLPKNLTTPQESELEHEFPTRGLHKFTETSLNQCSDKHQFQITTNNQNECITKCPLGQYGDLNDYTCHTCDKSCSSCYGPSYNNCLSCPKYFLSNNICAKSCPDGFFPDSAKHQCYPCLSSCETCEFNEMCSTCKSGLFLDFQKCVPTCPVGKYVYQQTCRKCHQSCATCYGPLSSNCLTCPDSYFWHNSTCLIQCPEHFSASDEFSCNRCHRSCQYCSDSSSCTRCYKNWTQKSPDTCIFNSKCNNGWYNHHLDSCEACNPYCEQCSGPNNHDCIYCDTGYLWLEGQCTETCPDGYFIREDECALCDNTCSKCEKQDKCLLCKDDFVLHFGKCYPSCPLGYWLRLDNGKKVCDICDPACLHCTGVSDSNCTSCNIGYYLVDKTCLFKCPDGFFPIIYGEESDCLPCYSTCKKCTDFGPMHCTSCYDQSAFSGDSSHSGGFCIPCLDSEFYNKTSRKCERCHANCGRCFGPKENHCLSCFAPLRLDEVKHVCLPCCHGSQMEKSECCTCSKNLDICVNSDHPRSISVNLSAQGYEEVEIPLRHVVPIVIVICTSVVLLYVVLFGLLQANSMGLCRFKFGGQKYERVPNNLAAKFDAEMEKVSLTQEDLEDEDDIYEKV